VIEPQANRHSGTGGGRPGRPIALALAVALVAEFGLAADQPLRFPRRNAVVAAVERAAPAVVNISTEQIVVRRGDPFFAFRDPFFDDFFRDYFERFSRPQRFKTHSLGSGVVIDPEGHVVTNEHVVRKASRIQLTLSDGKTTCEGRLLSADAEHDLALIQVVNPKGSLPAIKMGRSDDLMPGETVIALGNPFGLESTVTVGVVSATNRSIVLNGREAYSGLIQTDAAINPGNSGGALVNINGELVGINVAIYAEAQGIGFAIPVDKVREVLRGLFNYRLVNNTWLGLKVADARERNGGVAITEVEPRSPAAEAGLKRGDVILAADARPTPDTIAFFKAMLEKKVGEKVTLRVRQDGKIADFSLSVAAVPKPSGRELARRRLGLDLQEMTPELADSFGLRRPTGLLVVGVEKGGPGDQAGLARGDVVLRFGPVSLRTLDQLAIILDQIGEARASLLILRRGRLYRTTIVPR